MVKGTKSRGIFRKLFPQAALGLFLTAASVPVTAQDIKSAIAAFLPDISASGGIAVVPRNFWHSGNFTALSSGLPAFLNPASPGKMPNLLDMDMDATATTVYEGDLWFKKLGLTTGLKVDVDDNFVGKFSRILGYMGYHGYTLRVDFSRLKGDYEWDGVSVPGMPANGPFDNPYIAVDVLHHPDGDGVDLYVGVGYSTYRLPVQLEALVADGGDVRYGEHVYQEDMGIRIYSFLFGLDSLQSTFLGSRGTANFGEGFQPWVVTQDRFGFGIASISAEAESWIEAANGKSLRDDRRFVTAAELTLTLGVQWVGRAGPARIGAGLGYTAGFRTISTLPAWMDRISRADQVEASPNMYLLNHGVILRLIASW